MIRRLFGLIRDRKGAAAVEFAFIAPALCMLAVGTAYFGIALSQYIMLTEAVATGARQFALSKCGSVSGCTGSPYTTPRTTTVNLMQSAAPNLVSTSMAITTRVNGSVCASDPACQTALTGATGTTPTVTVSATYPCDLQVFGYNFAPNGCTLSSTMVERIQ